MQNTMGLNWSAWIFKTVTIDRGFLIRDADALSAQKTIVE